MAAKQISFPQWYEDGERASAADIKRLVESLKHFEDWGDLNARTDWRWCDVPRAVFEPMLYADAAAFTFEHIKDEDEDGAQDRETSAKLVVEMKQIGVTQHFEQAPPVVWLGGGRHGIEVLSDEYPVGVAFHEFGVQSIRALVAMKGANRLIPRKRVAVWTNPPNWSAHALDERGPRFEEDLSLRGGAVKLAFVEIVGDINGVMTADQVEAARRYAREWSGSGRDERLDQEPEYPAVRSPKRVAAMDAAADEVITFLDRCVEMGVGIVAGKDAALFKPGRTR
ncbi:MAG: hypothetical protein AB7L65_01275 [Hyphomonadaceae bacterium]